PTAPQYERARHAVVPIFSRPHVNRETLPRSGVRGERIGEHVAVLPLAVAVRFSRAHRLARAPRSSLAGNRRLPLRTRARDRAVGGPRRSLAAQCERARPALCEFQRGAAVNFARSLAASSSNAPASGWNVKRTRW